MAAGPPDEKIVAASPDALSEDEESGASEGQEQLSARIGLMVGPYRLTRCLGQGGMGVVYHAVHTEIGKEVAIKVLAARMARSAGYRQRFLHEAQAGSRVQHPGLVQIFGYGELQDATPYILMEYLVGRLLRATMAQGERGQLDVAAALRITKQLAEAMAAAHVAGVIHRDLKPENIMLVDDPEADTRARILDFGIAKLLQAPDYRTLTGPDQPLIGTPIYMSPEQCRGERQVDGKSDVYSLGVMLYEMLCGRTPFLSDPRNPSRVVYRHIFDHPMPLETLRRGLSQEVSALVLHMLEKDSEKRPPMAEVAAQIERLLASSPGSFISPLPRIEKRTGIRIAIRWGMVILVLLLPALWLIDYYYKHGEFFVPGRAPSMARIAAARFVMGSTNDERLRAKRALARTEPNDKGVEDLLARETPQRRVSVQAFYVDVREVTNQQYTDFLNRLFDSTSRNSDVELRLTRNGHAALSLWHQRIVRIGEDTLLDIYPKPAMGVYWDGTRFRVKSGMADWPIVQVTYEGARLYCDANHKRLPTEAEWELAARGGEGRTFPWGAALPTCRSAIFDWRDSILTCATAPAGPAPVASTALDRTPEGVYDMAGNVAEWVSDYYRQHYISCETEAECDDPVVLTDSLVASEAGRRVVRGGSWYREFDALRGAGRSRSLATDVTSDVGFRCVKAIR